MTLLEFIDKHNEGLAILMVWVVFVIAIKWKESQ